MEEVIARIKGYVLILYPTLLADLELTDVQLNFTIASVVDRALSFMNRQQLVAQYELDLADSSVEAGDYVLPIPSEVERVLASSVVESMKTLKGGNTAEAIGAIKSISDNGQSISYSDKVMGFFNSSSDADIFSGTVELLKKYILATVTDHDDSYDVQNYYSESIL